MLKHICCALLAVCLAFSLSSVVFAQGAPTPVPPSTQGPSQLDREGTINDIVNRWGVDEVTAYELAVTLPHASDEMLTDAWYAESLDEVRAVLLDGPESALGDAGEDWVFTAATPCRIVDTRVAGGQIAGATSREFYAHGTGVLMAAQGGGDCVSPVGEPRAVMINVTVVPSASSGFLKVYPSDVAAPPASFINYRPFTQVANAGTIQTGYAVGRDIEVYASTSTHVVIDVMGFYVVPGLTPVSTVQQSAPFVIAAGANSTVASPACPTGYTITGGGCGWGIYNSSLSIIGSRPLSTTQWWCDARNATAGAQTMTAYGICSRVPGR